ncbi:hypothetical protein FB459_0273 [Yimella lutea]|uniref:Spore-associated protein A n=1 Tax=Yimella lutea TaxID=587872 RepID=A0A542EC98_9MICO|nr:hypothetical protein [Yimella lutea]TQJ12896.1 hypothetical protein FB459_0273 [Yimella lutea]
MRNMKITGSLAVAGAIAIGGIGLANAGGASAHSASDVIRQGCGSGYSVVKDGHRGIYKNGKKWGDVYLTYNATNGMNCVVTRKVAWHGTYTPTLARLDVANDGRGYVQDWKKYKYFAATKAYGKGKCVAYWGDIRPGWDARPHASAGRWTWGNCG